jgi:hypothetical protein
MRLSNAPVVLAFAFVVGAVVPHAAAAQAQDTARIARLERQMEAVSRELERLRLGQDVVRADSSVLGLGPAASRVYRVEQGVSVGGYGEVLYENFSRRTEGGAPAGVRDVFDALRAIVYVGYKFDDRLLFNSEIEIEHADEIYLEFAYLDYRLSESWGVRAGLLLAPLGLINELHEPAVYLGTKRPVTETRIIPSTWRENGIGLFGGTDALSWRIYLMNSFNGAGFNDQGLRGGRQKGSVALAEDLGVAARIDYVGTPGLIVGGSAYAGETAQGRQLAGEDVGATTYIWDAHVDFKYRGLDLRALVASASVGEVAKMNQLNGLAGADGIGESMLGWYAQAGYDVLRGSAHTHQLIPYVRYERVNTQRSVPVGYAIDPANELQVTSIGLAWKPVPQAVAKVDFQLHSNEADTGVNQFNFQLGWLF